MFIYVITNTVTGKIYIGQHKGADLMQYLQKKFHYSRKQSTGSSYLFNAMRKYPDYKQWEIHPLLSDVETRAALNIWETLLIELFDARNPEVGYNICRGGEGRTAPLSPEETAKLRANNKAYWDRLGLVGQTFNRLTVVSEVPERAGGGKKKWNCQCSCGNTSRVETSHLKSGNIKSCGCLISEAATKRVGGVELVGMRFGRLVVEAYDGRCPWNQKLWKCKCDCGNSIVARTAALKGNRTQSCGCLAKSKNADARAEAIRLRVEYGMRLTDIALQLKVPAPTCCIWLKAYPLTSPAIPDANPLVLVDKAPKLSERQLALSNGAKRYVTGIPCKHGHLSYRVTRNGACIICARDWMRQRRAALKVTSQAGIYIQKQNTIKTSD